MKLLLDAAAAAAAAAAVPLVCVRGEKKGRVGLVTEVVEEDGVEEEDEEEALVEELEDEGP